MNRHRPVSYPYRQSGAVVVLVALLLVVLFGFAALAIDVGNAYLVRGQMQNAADAAAHAGAVALAQPDGGEDQAEAAAIKFARANGFTLTAAEISFPAGGEGTGLTPGRYVQVEFTPQETSLFLGQIIGADKWKISAKAVAGVTATHYPNCIVTVNHFQINGTDIATLDHCSAVIGNEDRGLGLNPKNKNKSGIVIDGSGSITVYNSGNSTCDACRPTPTKSEDPPPDLPASVEAPSSGLPERTYTSCPSGGCEPGRYTKELSTSGSVTFKPGFYEFTKGLKTDKHGTATGDGVTFYISPGQDLDLQGKVTLTAPSTCSGGTVSTVLYVALPPPPKEPPPTEPPIKKLSWGGNNYDLKLTGVVDLRNVDLVINGTSADLSLTGSLITNSLDMKGNVNPTAASNPCHNVYSNSATTVSIFE